MLKGRHEKNVSKVTVLLKYHPKLAYRYDEIRDELHMSMGAVNNIVRKLKSDGKIGRILIPTNYGGVLKKMAYFFWNKPYVVEIGEEKIKCLSWWGAIDMVRENLLKEGDTATVLSGKDITTFKKVGKGIQKEEIDANKQKAVLDDPTVK